MTKPPVKKKPVATRAREMPMTDLQAEAAIQTLRNDAGSAAFRKKQSAKNLNSDERNRHHKSR
jgi:hypothetical protein